MRDSVIAVIGGTGFIGQHVVRHLCAARAQVRVPCRHPKRAYFLKPLGDVGQVAPLPLDAFDDASLGAALAGVDGVVNLVGVLFERRDGDFDRLHGELPARIGRFAPAGARIVHVSAIGSDANAQSRYAASKGKGEGGLRQVRPDAVILRPSVVFGPEDEFLNRFARMAVNAPFLPAIGGGHTKFQPVFVTDVAHAALAALSRDDAPGRTYELGGPQVLTFKQIMEWLLATLRRRKLVLPISFKLADFQARILQRLPNPLLTQDQVLQLRSDNVVADGASTLRDLDIAPTPMEVAAPPYLQQFVRTQKRRLETGKS